MADIEVEVRSPKVPMTSDTEETAMANVSQNPDFSTDSSAKKSSFPPPSPQPGEIGKAAFGLLLKSFRKCP